MKNQRSKEVKKYRCPKCNREVTIYAFDKETGKCKKYFHKGVRELTALVEEQYDRDEITGFRD